MCWKEKLTLVLAQGLLKPLGQSVPPRKTSLTASSLDVCTAVLIWDGFFPSSMGRLGYELLGCRFCCTLVLHKCGLYTQAVSKLLIASSNKTFVWSTHVFVIDSWSMLFANLVSLNENNDISFEVPLSIGVQPGIFHSYFQILVALRSTSWCNN